MQTISEAGFKLRSGIQLFAVPFIIFSVSSMVPFSAYGFDFESGDFSGNIDTTLTYGSAFRVGSPDKRIVGPSADLATLPGAASATTGTAFSENADDGNQNFDRGFISNLGKFTTEVKLEYGNVGLFSRFNGFKDYQNVNAGDRLALSGKARRLVGQNVNLQDLYAWVDFSVGSMPASVRVGEQVISWGESTFIQNGINVSNPFDVSKLRTPGSRVRDALIPVGMVSFQIAPTNALSLEFYYQYDWERTIVEPVGSFFSTNDYVGDGGRKVMLGFGDASDRGTSFGPLTAAINADLNQVAGAPAPVLNQAGLAGNSPAALKKIEPDFLGVLRAADDRARNGGEFGLGLRYFSEELNDTEFGVFFIQHHSRTPIISGTTGTARGLLNANAAAASMTGLLAPAGVGNNVATALAARATAAGVDPAKIPALVAAQVGTVATSVVTDQYARTANYVIEYPEYIRRLGLSFNTQLPGSGLALQGEYTFTHDAPLQIDDVELLLQALCPLAGLNPAVRRNQLDPGCKNTKPGQYLPGFIERNISQVQMTATYVLGPVIGANQGVMVGEVGVTHVHNMPKKSNLRLNGAGTFTSGNAFHSTAAGAHPGKAAESAARFADATSWGYRIAGRLDYNSLIGPFNVSPRFAFSHDVSGITPGPGGNFLEGRKALTLGVSTDYQNDVQADISYTKFMGAGRYNLLNDRDFVAFNLNYFF